MLNRAHFLHRQAEKAARKGNVEEAIQVWTAYQTKLVVISSGIVTLI